MNMRKEYDFRQGKRGAVLPSAPGKTRITIRIDDDVLEWFRHQAESAGGGSYQTMINEALRGVTTEGPTKIESVIRKVVREELRRTGESKRAKRARAA
jgi:BrnA antitoxin of type II toxin-antitoxin system